MKKDTLVAIASVTGSLLSLGATILNSYVNEQKLDEIQKTVDEKLAKGFDEREFRMKIFAEDFASYGQEVLKTFVDATVKSAGDIDVISKSESNSDINATKFQIVLNGDVPILRTETIKRFIKPVIKPFVQAYVYCKLFIIINGKYIIDYIKEERKTAEYNKEVVEKFYKEYGHKFR